MKYRLHRIGSDPEFIFGRLTDYSFQLVGADTIMGGNKSKTTASFIGTDNHPSTAELRPGASHNIKLHLYDVAVAIDAIDRYLKKRPGLTDVAMYAVPFLEGKTMGGHLHGSFFMDCPTTVLLNGLNIWWHCGTFRRLDENRPQGSLSSENQIKIREKINKGEVLTAGSWAHAMGYLSQPLEMWLQPWFLRMKRNIHYGAEQGGDVVRAGVSVRPDGVHPTMAYCHWEYRLPSTWLVHPWLAFCYLGLFKLSMLNLGRLQAITYRETPKLDSESDIQQPTDPPPQPPTPKAGNLTNRQLLMARLDEIRTTGPLVISADLKELDFALSQCDMKRDTWFSPNTPIDVEAWRRLL